ncbi:MAG TPA: excinuclease ABC subunit UvrA [Polyangia bacterium]|nr:excinuclease ABC subunit UvrA [Polyangia bacterium]
MRKRSGEALESDVIVVKGAREHNLDIGYLEIPKRQLVVFTGVSGSGKSSLAFDTLYAEGQRRYVESLSSYARQFLGQMEKPKYEHIRGLSPTIAIEQKSASHNPRSTVGTVTEIYDYLRVLYARAGEQRCHQCGGPVAARSAAEIVDELLAMPKGTKVTLLAPKVEHRKGEFRELLDDARKEGFVRARIDGMVVRLEDVQGLEKLKKHTIELVIDRLTLAATERARLTDSVEQALRAGKGAIGVLVDGEERARAYSEARGCPKCGVGLPELTPQMLSFNSPLGMCPHCSGLGKVDLGWEHQSGEGWKLEGEACNECHGLRLRPESRAVFLAGKSISDATGLTVADAGKHFATMKLAGAKQQIAFEVLKEINARLGFLNDVGLEYLTLDRATETLSGGEAQRIRLASQLGSELSGVMYVLDEPSIGLHQRDNLRLIATLRRLRDLGNSVLVVEHDAETIESADWVLDFGPGAGIRGGKVVSQGTPADLRADKKSPTGRFLSGKDAIGVPETRRRPSGWIEIRGATENNLKNVDCRFPLGVLCAVTGVSGAGKSSLINQILHPALRRQLHDAQVRVGAHKSLAGVELIDKVIDIDQNPIGRTPRSNPATYTKAFDHIRNLFAGTQEARTYGYAPGRFSFNVRGGRCEACEGDGVREVEMHFLANVHVQCEVCRGKRFNDATLRVQWKGKNITEILGTTVAEALDVFANQPQIVHILKTLDDVGLGYVQLGQAATTLSGGEAQRIKLSRELAKRDTGRTLYVLDEPTTGLHFGDIQRLMAVLDRLVASGNTVLVIEHNLDVIKRADWIIDLGPEGGARGGEIIAQGTPEAVADVKRSYTGQFLQKILPRKRKVA